MLHIRYAKKGKQLSLLKFLHNPSIIIVKNPWISQTNSSTFISRGALSLFCIHMCAARVLFKQNPPLQGSAFHQNPPHAPRVTFQQNHPNQGSLFRDFNKIFQNGVTFWSSHKNNFHEGSRLTKIALTKGESSGKFAKT